MLLAVTVEKSPATESEEGGKGGSGGAVLTATRESVGSIVQKGKFSAGTWTAE